MWFHSITAEYNGPLAAAHACIVDDRYDLAECTDALCCFRPILDLSDHLRGFSIAAKDASRLSSANVLV